MRLVDGLPELQFRCRNSRISPPNRVSGRSHKLWLPMPARSCWGNVPSE